MFNREPSSNIQRGMRILEARENRAFNKIKDEDGERFQIWDSKKEKREGIWRREREIERWERRSREFGVRNSDEEE